MNLVKKLLFSKYGILVTLGLLVFILFIILPGFFFKSDSAVPVLSSLYDSYLGLIEMFANKLLEWTGTGIVISNRTVLMGGVALTGFTPELYFKKWMILFLILIWITKTTLWRKVLFTFYLIITHFLVISVYLATGAHLAGSGNHNVTLVTIPLTSGMLILFTIVFTWYRKHKDMILSKLSRLSLNTRIFQNDHHFLIAAYIYIIANYFLYDIFDYDIWISFLFRASQKILVLAGYVATIEPNYLIGDNGTIFMLKSCLGYQTMLLFAIIVFLTGSTSYRIRWIFIIFGIFFLNFVNILRFVLLFIHIQKHGDYMLAMDVHDMYNYIIYTLVFVLWVVWFEKLADYRQKKKIPDDTCIS